MSYARLAMCGAVLAALMATGTGALPALAQEQTVAAQAPAAGAERPEPLSDDELEQLVARIALYPDDLVALVCAASLFPLQIVEAERFLEKREKDKSLQPKEEWDGSVISLLNYPEVLKMMSEDLEWTQALGDALANQQKEVLTAIQQLRDEAVAKDIIKTDDKVKVVTSGDNILIEPATPEKIYVPRYEPEMLYVENYAPQPVSYYTDPYPNYYWPSAGFWAGAVTGGLFAAAIDWDDWGVWGGNWGGDVDLDIDCNNCGNNINGKFDFKDVDWRNVDRSKINFDRNQLANIDRTQIRGGLETNRANSIRDRADTASRDRATQRSDRTARANDVRKSAVDRAQRPGADRPAASQRPRQNVDRANVQRPSGGAPRASTRPSSGKAGSRPSGKPKAGARADNRPRKPSGVGNPSRGKTARQHSNRGRQSVGGGSRGGGRQMRGGGHRGGGGMRGGGRGRGGGGRGGRR
jgi:hypothetical protein